MKIGRVSRTTYEHSYLPVNLKLRPTCSSPKTISFPGKLVKTKDQLKVWVEEGLSTKQIAEQLGTSKTWVVDELKKRGIYVPKTGRMTNPDNYRHHTPPFGWVVRNGKLHPCQKQQRVCRLIVQWRNRDCLSFNAIAKNLTTGKYKNSRGTTYWDHKSTQKIYENWKTKYVMEAK